MGRSGRPRVSVVIPTRNEARNVEELLPAIGEVRPMVGEVIVADCGSVDGTADTARRLLPTAKVVTQTRTGKGNALACGFAAATGDIIVTFDADGAADPAEIPVFVAALVAGADVVTGSRFLAGGPAIGGGALLRRRTALLNGVATAFFGATQTDLCFGYHAFWADLLPVLDLPPIAIPATGTPWGDGSEIDTLLSCRFAAAGHRLTEVVSVERTPAGGRPRRTIADDRRVLHALTTERRRTRRQRRVRGAIGSLPIPGPRRG
jgi:glycosyltransferase involved in cell wall biosynthesis